MYKLLLALRYLFTRYIAMASIISVMLGVATMIVVNSVMSGFTSEMQNRIHGILSDVVLESQSLNGFPDAKAHMDKVRQIAGDSIAGMTPTVYVPAMLNFRCGDDWVTRQVQVIGIDETTQGNVSDFGKYLQHPANRSQMSFQLRDSGYDTVDHQGGDDAVLRPQLAAAGWKHRRLMAETRKFQEKLVQPDNAPKDPFAQANVVDPNVVDPAKDQFPGAVVGIALASYRTPEGEDRFLALPGDDITLTFPNAAEPPNVPKAVGGRFTIVDFYDSKMSEYDSSFIFVPIKELQNDRGMFDRATGTRWVNSIQIKLKPGVDGDMVRNQLIRAFPPQFYRVQTWRDKQLAILSAVSMETTILNILLFLIIAVSGFGILAIFFMIVVEKTRDIGILKSLGASGQGIMTIFLSYGLALGLVGSGMGMVLGLVIVKYINPIADFVGWLRGAKIFDPSVYYFYKIPTLRDPWTVTWIVCGALAIAVFASVLPALRAARLHPVEALRHE